MAYAGDRLTTVKLDASPSLVWGNLAAGPTALAFAHKDAVYLLDLRSLDGRSHPALDKLPIREPLAAVTGVAWPALTARTMLAVTTRAGVSLWDHDARACRRSFSLTELGLTPADGACWVWGRRGAWVARGGAHFPHT